MTVERWSVIAAIRAEPDYRFQYSEAAMARRMAKDGLLRPRGDKKYAVTTKGLREFRRGSVAN